MFLVAVCAAFLLIGGAADAGAPPPPTTEYVVQSGDTLWAIAGDLVDAGEDVRVMVSAIKTLSGLDSSTLHPGQVLVVPG
ncbi:MAG TPA: LysM peptidoglycan-binding domain-containing protein [Acidimicrobiia bacterium]